MSEADRQLIREFHQREQQRQQRLLPACPYPVQELDALLEVLKFCDLLSLYLCSGAREHVEFPNRITDRLVQACWGQHDEVYHFDPSPFQPDGEPRLVSLGVTARYFEKNVEPRLGTLDFLLA